MNLLDMIFDQNNFPFWIIVIAAIIGPIAIISRPFSTYVKFVYPNAKFEAMGNPFVGDKELDSIVDSKDIVSFKETINTLKDYNVSGDDTYSIQKSLDDTFIETVEMMRNDSSKKMNDFFDTYLEKLDIHLIKNHLKIKLEGREIDEKRINDSILSSTRKLLAKIMDAEKEELPQILKDYGFDNELIQVVSMDTVDFLKIDTIIDKYVINKFTQVKVPYKCEQGKRRFVKTLTDIINIKNVLRAKQLGYDEESCKKLFIGEGREIPPWKYNELSELESVSQIINSLEGTSYYDALKDTIEIYNKEQSVQVLETALDSLLLKHVRDISTQNYISIGPTIRFLVSKEFEIRNLKIITKGVSENISPDVIKTFLVKEVY